MQTSGLPDVGDRALELLGDYIWWHQQQQLKPVSLRDQAEQASWLIPGGVGRSALSRIPGVRQLLGKLGGGLTSLANRLRALRPVARHSDQAAAAARLETGRYLSASWYQATFPNKVQSLRAHWQKHVQEQGLNKSFREYTDDARAVFGQHRSAAQEITLRDGTPGLRIRTGRKQPGGIYTPDGRIVTFWYR